MTDAEAIMWTVEKDPALRSDFLNVTILEHKPDEERLRAKLEAALDEIPRLTQRVVSPPLRIAPPAWRPDPDFDLDYHVRKVALPAPGGRRELLDLSAAVAAAPLDRSRPLWEFTLVEGLDGGGAAILQKVHHTVTDGVGGIKLSLSLVDFEPNPPDAPTTETPVRRIVAEVKANERHAGVVDPIDRTTPADVLRDGLAFMVRAQISRARGAIDAALGLVAHPDRAGRGVSDAVALARSVRRQVLVTEPARSPLMTARSSRRRFETFRAPLDDARTVANRLGGTVNDVFVTGVTGALGLYHDRMGTPSDELRMAMPISTRRDDESTGSNQFAPTRVIVPVQPKDPHERFRLVHDRLSALRDEPAIAAAGSLAGLLAPVPTALLVALTRSQARTIDFATSNLRGSPVDLYVGGARIEANYPMGPRTGCALNVTLLSYKGSLDMGLNIDPAAITDAPALLDCFSESFDDLLAVA